MDEAAEVQRILDTNLYDLIGVPADGTVEEISKACFNKASICHPSRETSNSTTLTMFKRIAQAYYILTNDTARALYDQDGMAPFLKGSNGIDSSDLMTFIFGTVDFLELTGIPTIAQLAVIHERKAVQNEKDLGKQLSLIESLLLAEEDAIATILANKYTVKLEPFVQGVTTDWEKLITNDLQDKLRRPGGPTLLAMIAEVFGSLAKKRMSRVNGDFILVEKDKSKFIAEALLNLTAVRRLYSLQSVPKQKLSAEELNKQVLDKSLVQLWRTGIKELEKLLKKVCEVLLSDPSVSENEIRSRAMGLDKMNKLYSDAVKSYMKLEDQAYIEFVKGISIARLSTMDSYRNSWDTESSDSERKGRARSKRITINNVGVSDGPPSPVTPPQPMITREQAQSEIIHITSLGQSIPFALLHHAFGFTDV